MTVHKLSAGDGYTYYTREVASGDELRATGRELGDYYHLSGYPPGQWGGRGATHLEVNGEVTEKQMQLLYGEGLHPRFGETSERTGKPFEKKLGQRYKRFTQNENILHHRINTALGDFERLQHRAPGVDERRVIRAKVGAQYFRELHGRNPASKEELGRFISQQMHPAAQAVAGFDLVFSPPKSVSYLWGVGDEQTRSEHRAGALRGRGIDHEIPRGHRGVYAAGEERGAAAGRGRRPDLHPVPALRLPRRGPATARPRGGLQQGAGHRRQVGNPRRGAAVPVQRGSQRTLQPPRLENVCASLGVATSLRQVPGKRPVTEIAGIDVAAIEAASSRRGRIQQALDGTGGQVLIRARIRA